MWTILKNLGYEQDNNHRRMVWARCSCGKEKAVALCNIESGASKSCGCERKRRIDATQYIGQKFNEFTIIGIAPPKNRRTMVRIRCNCGSKERVRPLSYVKNGTLRSCGCLRSISQKQGNKKKDLPRTALRRISEIVEDPASSRVALKALASDKNIKGALNVILKYSTNDNVQKIAYTALK